MDPATGVPDTYEEGQLAKPSANARMHAPLACNRTSEVDEPLHSLIIRQLSPALNATHVQGSGIWIDRAERLRVALRQKCDPPRTCHHFGKLSCQQQARNCLRGRCTLTDTQQGASKATPQRRHHTRIAARGEITLRSKDGNGALLVRGQLLNVSADGFRLKHQNRDLRIGQELIAIHGTGEVTVRVTWTTPLIGGYIESGFVILSQCGKPARRWLVLGCLALVGLLLLPPQALIAQQQQQEEQQTRKATTKVQPHYPDLARKMHLRGTVRIEVTIAPQGTAKSTRPLGGNPVFVDAALDALKKWRWEAGSKETTEIIAFHFDDSSAWN